MAPFSLDSAIDICPVFDVSRPHFDSIGLCNGVHHHVLHVLQLLKAPVDGTVQQLAVHTAGGGVTPAQALLVVVPADSLLHPSPLIDTFGREPEMGPDRFRGLEAPGITAT